MTIKNHGTFPVGARVVGASKANPVRDVGTVVEVREFHTIVKWDRTGHLMNHGHAEIMAARPGDVPFFGTNAEWHMENHRRQRAAVANFIANHVCTDGCRHAAFGG